MIKAYYKDKNTSIMDENFSFVIEDKPFRCILSGYINKKIDKIQKIDFSFGKFQAEFLMQKATREDTGETFIAGDSWDVEESKKSIMNLKENDDLEKIFIGTAIQRRGNIAKLKANFSNIAPRDFKERFIYIARWQKFLANYYGKKSVILGENPPQNLIPLGKKFLVGATFEYKPIKEYDYFFKKKSYEATEIYGKNNKDIMLFDTCDAGTVISLQRSFDGLNQDWRAFCIKL